jgi:hypothetical protein
MAIDATSGGWGLTPVGTATQSTTPLAPRPTMNFSPDQIRAMREQAMALQQPPKQNIQSWTQGVAELVRAMQGNREADFARQQEQQGRQQGAEAIGQIYAPYLSPGGSSPSATGAAPAGALGSDTAGATPSADASPYAATIASIETGGSKNPYSITGPVTKTGDMPYGKYQVMGANIPEWTKETLGKSMTPQEFLANPQAQDAVFNAKFGQYAQKYGPEGAAKAWFAGEGGMNNPNAKDSLGTSVSDYASKFNAGPTGLLAPIPAAAPAVPPTAAATQPVRLAYAGPGNPPMPAQGGQVPAAIAPSPQAPLVNAIAGKPVPPAIPPADFARQVAAMEAAKTAPVVPPNVTQAQPIPPAQFAQQAAAMEAAKAAPSPATAVPPITAPPSAAPAPVAAMPSPVPTPPAPISPVPGAVGPTSVGGAPLAGTTPANAAMVNAIAGGAPGASNPATPIRVAQNGMPTSLAPSAAGAPSGLPQPLTSATGQVTQEQLTRVLANPWVPDSAKSAMLQMIQQRGQPQTMPIEGGTLMFNAAGQRVFIPEPKFGTIKVGSAEIPTVSRFDPTTKQWNTTTMAPGGGVQTAGGAATGMPPKPGEPDLSSIGGIQANEAAQAGAKKSAEEGAVTSAKYYDAVHRGLAGSAMIAAQQKQNIDALRQISSSPDFTSGTFSDSALAMQRLAASVGINPTGAAPRELFNQLAAKVLADQFSGLKSMASETGEAGGRIFKPMLDIEEKANITPDDTQAGINAKLNLLDHAGNLMMKYGDLADDYIKDHGKLDAGFDKAIRKEIAGSRLPDVVPQANAGAPDQSAIEAEMRKRGLLKPPAAPVSQ